MRMPPPGASSTLANKVRARAIKSRSSGFSPSAARSSFNCRSGIRTHAASRVLIRPAISAAPALVKVRHRIAPGSKIGRAHVRTPVTNAQSVCRLLLEKKKIKEKEEKNEDKKINKSES